MNGVTWFLFQLRKILIVLKADNGFFRQGIYIIVFYFNLSIHIHAGYKALVVIFKMRVNFGTSFCG